MANLAERPGGLPMQATMDVAYDLKSSSAWFQSTTLQKADT